MIVCNISTIKIQTVLLFLNYMKAAFRDQYGGTNVIKLLDVAQPVPRPDEVLVKVHATTVNRTDEGVLMGKPWIFRLFVGLPSPRHKILGTDFAGTITQIGNEVTKYKVGDRVWGFYDQAHPTQAEFTCVPENGKMRLIPNGWNFTDIVACGEGAHYARNFINKVKLQKGQYALVYGSTGAIGSALLQMLKYHGLYVTAVCQGKHAELMKSIGADKVIDYMTEDFTKQDIKYDYVLDAAGKSNFAQCSKVLKEKGIYISSELGPGNENLYLPLTTLFSKKKVIFPMPTDIQKSLDYMHELIEKNAFKPVIEKIYPFDQIVDAYTHMLSQQKIGNLVVEISKENT